MTLLEFYDIIVGQEVAEDFAEENVEHIKRLGKSVIGWFRKKIPGKRMILTIVYYLSNVCSGYGRSLDINDEKSIQAMQLSEYLELVESRWKQGCKD